MGEISISGWYSKVCEELEVEEVSGIEVTDLEYTFDPVHAILIEKVYVEKYGKEEWIRVTKEAPSKVREFSIMVKLFLTSEEKGLAYMFKNHTWRLLPTQSKIKKYAEALSLSDLVHHLKSDIITELMNQKNVIAFRDCVIDIDRYGDGFRRGEPSDFVTVSLDYNIQGDKSGEQLNNLLNKILPRENLREYFLYHLASCLSYGNLDKVFVIWSGLGSNARLNRYLLAFIQESDEKEVVNVGTLKELTGNDTIYTRDLYAAPKTIDVRFIPFESKFTLKKDEVDEENNIYLMDPKFIKDVKSLAPAFMELLLEYYDRYRKLGKLPDCPEVMQATEDLKKNNSPAS
ncbi:hypothetical protein LPJ76_006385, partial [Coemansia sp. RSA 638]